MHYIKKAILNDYTIYKQHKTQNNHSTHLFHVYIFDQQVGVSTWTSSSVLKIEFRPPNP